MAYRQYGGGGYYQRPGGYGGGAGGPMNLFGRVTPTVTYLLIANFAVFVLSVFAQGIIVGLFSLVPVLVFPGAQVWRLVTYMFVHADFAHILFNMITLFFFGPPLEQIWGQKKFLIYYFLTGIGAGIVCVPFYILFGGADVPIVGASGALFGLLMAFALIYPNARVYLWFLVPIKVKWLVAIFMVVELTATASYMGGGTGSAVASIAHLSGAAIGYFYLRRFMDIKAYWLRFKMRKKQRPYRVAPPPDDDRPGPWLH